jgi:lysophospholipase
MLGFKNESLLTLITLLSFPFVKKDEYLFLSKPNFGKETPFIENDLTNDIMRYERTLNLVRLYPEIRLWGITNAWAQAVRIRLKELRNDSVIKNTETKILVFNSLQDSVVDPNKIIRTISKMKNSTIINFENCKHEILMEKDIYRKELWNEFDQFISNL